jgi:DNA mismatch repair protein MutS2
MRRLLAAVLSLAACHLCGALRPLRSVAFGLNAATRTFNGGARHHRPVRWLPERAALTALSTTTDAPPAARAAEADAESDEAFARTELERHSLEAIDFPELMALVVAEAQTLPGRELLPRSFHRDASDVRAAYAQLEELAPSLEQLPLHGEFALGRLLRGLALQHAPPSRGDLRAAADDVAALDALGDWLEAEQQAQRLRLFNATREALRLPVAVVDTFRDAFVAVGAAAEATLSPAKYPAIGALAERVAALETQIRATLRQLTLRPELRHVWAADPARAEAVRVDGRFCLPVLAAHKRFVGVARAASGSGRTAYVEPRAVAADNDALLATEAALRRAEARVFFDMARALATHRAALEAALAAVGALDALRAKHRFVARLLPPTQRYCVPQVGADGELRVAAARHPLLLQQRGATLGAAAAWASVVPIALTLTAAQPALVVSGPNAGGKTVALKTAALLAAMVRYALPLPVEGAARVDCFALIAADIGDAQSLRRERSTFAGHLALLRDVFAAVAQSPRHALVLLDEAGGGTDPAQGAALAQAALEALSAVPTVRLLATTHYASLKLFAASSSRCGAAAMDSVDGRPTFRLRSGGAGDSFALALARRVGLPRDVLQRATELLDADSRRAAELHALLEERLAAVEAERAALDAQRRQLAAAEDAAARERSAWRAEVQRVRDAAFAEHVQALRQHEREAQQLLRDADALVAARRRALDEARDLVEHCGLQLRALGAPAAPAAAAMPPPSSDAGDEALAAQTRELNATVAALAERREAAEAQQAARDRDELRLAPLPTDAALEVGDAVVVLQRGLLFGTRATVTRRCRPRGRSAQLRCAGGVALTLPRELLGVANDSALLRRAAGTDELRAIPAALLGRLPRRSARNEVDVRASRDSAAQATAALDAWLAADGADLLLDALAVAEDAAAAAPVVVYLRHGATHPFKAPLRRHALATAQRGDGGLRDAFWPARAADGGDDCTVLLLGLDDDWSQ